MPKAVSINVYQYNELTESAKQKAREWFLSDYSLDAELAWDNITEDAKEIGLLIHELNPHKQNKGEFEKSALDCAKRVIANHGERCETYKTASHYIKQLSTFSEDDADETSAEYQSFINTEHEFLHALLEDYRIMLDIEIEYQRTDEYIADVMEANQYEFTENGKRFVV